MEKLPMTDEVRNLKFLAKKSMESIDIQVGSYRQQHTYAGTIIGIIFIFIPFFLSGLKDAGLIIQLISLVPIVLFFAGLLMLISIFRSKSLDPAFIIENFDDLIKASYKDTLLHVIDRNTRSFHHNKLLAAKASKRYDRGIKLSIIAMMISIVLLLANSFVKIKQAPIKFQLNPSTMEVKPTESQ